MLLRLALLVLLIQTAMDTEPPQWVAQVLLQLALLALLTLMDIPEPRQWAQLELATTKKCNKLLTRVKGMMY